MSPTQRAEAAGIVERRPDPRDGRVVHLAMTRKGSAALGRLSAQHSEELARLADGSPTLWKGLDRSASPVAASMTRGP